MEVTSHLTIYVTDLRVSKIVIYLFKYSILLIILLNQKSKRSKVYFRDTILTLHLKQ